MAYDIKFLSLDEISDLNEKEIRPRLERVIRKTKPDWSVERILELVNSRELFLGAVRKRGKIQGIVILQFIIDPSSLARGIFVWAMQVDSFNKLPQFVSKSLCELAEGSDCSFVRFGSPRNGWKGVIKLFPGWYEKGVIWEITNVQWRGSETRS